MIKKSYGCSVLVIGVVATTAWLAYGEVQARLERFRDDALRVQGASEADARAILGDPEYQIGYRDPERDFKIQELVSMYSGLEARRIEERALVYVRFRRCAVLYVNKLGTVTEVTYGEQK